MYCIAFYVAESMWINKSEQQQHQISFIPGLSNSNPLQGCMSMKKCSEGRRKQEKVPWRPQFTEEGSEGHISCQIWCFFLIQIAFIANFWPCTCISSIKVSINFDTFSILSSTRAALTLLAGRVFETPDLNSLENFPVVVMSHKTTLQKIFLKFTYFPQTYSS